MPFNFYDTHTLLMAVQQLTPEMNEPVRPDDVIYVRESLF